MLKAVYVLPTSRCVIYY